MVVWRRMRFTKRVISRHLRGGVLAVGCMVCGRRFRVGDVAWSRYRGCFNDPRTVHYCVKCYRKLWR